MVLAKIIVIDDAQPTRAKMRMFLEEAGHTVLEGRDGEDGLTILRSNMDTSLILCDVNMPVMDGITFATALKEEEGLKNIPLVMCTTETVESVRDDIKELGIRAWMTKPVSKKLLILALNKILKG
jgi:CheY-like chemotaxis protein